MDQSSAALALAIGVRVRQERQSRRWTLDQLAEAAGVSRRMVVNVEQGAANPSIGTLLRISDALGVGLPALVEAPEPSQVKVTLSVPKTLSPNAIWEYSWIRPPSRSLRRTRTFAPGAGGCGRPAGGPWCSARCGRCTL